MTNKPTLEDQLNYAEMTIGAAEDHIEILEAENKKLREALEFYAKEDSWDICDHYSFMKSNDNGNIARTVLKDVSE